jgi:phenylpyruvate tautomerase PptA (4-oxalocrotonate tautomerase family)
MPLIRISLRAGKPADYRQAIAENIYESLRETFNVPENDFFATVDELEPRDFIYDRKYFNIERTDDLVLIQLTVSNTRTVEQKKALYRRIVERLGKNPGLRSQDIFLNLLEVAKENGRSVTARRNTPNRIARQLSGGGKGTSKER